MAVAYGEVKSEKLKVKNKSYLYLLVISSIRAIRFNSLLNNNLRNPFNLWLFISIRAIRFNSLFQI